jgi:hypothetical protein
MARIRSFLDVKEEELVAPVLEEAVPAHHEKNGKLINVL